MTSTGMKIAAWLNIIVKPLNYREIGTTSSYGYKVCTYTKLFVTYRPYLMLCKKGTKPLPYPTQPYAITKEEAERRRVEKEKAEYEKMKAKTAAFASMFNASLNAQRREVENSE